MVTSYWGNADIGRESALSTDHRPLSLADVSREQTSPFSKSQKNFSSGKTMCLGLFVSNTVHKLLANI